MFPKFKCEFGNMGFFLIHNKNILVIQKYYSEVREPCPIINVKIISRKKRKENEQSSESLKSLLKLK